MAILDVARGALRPTNSIAQLAPTQPPQPAATPGASPTAAQLDPAARTLTPQAADRSAAAKKPAAQETPLSTEPEAIAKSYYIEDRGSERRYYDDYMRQALAMRATTSTISTKREDLNTIRAMLTVAEARGWQAVEIKGSDAFKREAWIEAHARGIEARGYQASDLDRQEADRRRAERGQPNQTPPAAAAPAVATPSAPAAAMLAETKVPKALSKTAPDAALVQAGKTAQVDGRRAVREAQAQLSSDARLVLAALIEKIDRQMNRHNTESKAQMKAFVAAELVKKERAEGPVVLSAAQKRAAQAAEPACDAPKPVPAQARRMEPEAPRRSLAR